MILRAASLVLGLLVASATARAADLPRWRMRAGLSQGFGGARDSGAGLAVFPTTLDLGVRFWGPLSLTASAIGVIAAEHVMECSVPERPNAMLGTLGLRVDFANTRQSSWVAPFFEVHVGGGGQAGGGRTVDGTCGEWRTFGSGGARLGMDVWLGKVAVTIMATFDYLPVASPLSLALGATFVLF